MHYINYQKSNSISLYHGSLEQKIVCESDKYQPSTTTTSTTPMWRSWTSVSSHLNSELPSV